MMTRTMVLTEPSGGGRTLYDYHLLAAHGFETFEPTRRASGPMRKIRDVLEHRTGAKWEEALRGIGRSASLIFGMLEQYLPTPTLLRRAHLAPFHDAYIAGISCWLAERLRTGDTSIRKQLALRFRNVDLLFCLSRNQLDIFAEHGFDTDRIVAIPYGFSPLFDDEPATTERDIPIMSVGLDRGRDYATLLRAARDLPEQMHIYAPDAQLNGLEIPTTVTVHRPVEYLDYRRLLARARIVVIPTYDFAYPTGQSVALEAAAAGACVIATKTEAMGDYFTDGETALMPAVSDSNELRERIVTALADDALVRYIAGQGKAHVYAQFTTEHMWSAIATELRARMAL